MVGQTGIRQDFGTVSINSQDFALAGDVVPYLLKPEGDAFRLQGVQVRKDNTKIGRWIYRWNKGVGWARQDRETGRGVGGLMDSTVETRFRTAELALLHEAQTHAAPADFIRKYVGPFKGDFFGFFEELYASGAITDAVCYKWDPDAWDAAGTIESAGANAQGMRVWDAISHEGRLWAAVTNDGSESGSNGVVISRSTDGATWEETGTSTQVTFAGGIQAVHRRNNFDDDVARLLSFGATLMIASADLSDLEIEVKYSVNPEAASPTFTAGAIIPSGSGPKALVRWLDPFSSPPADSPVLVTAEGVYRVDSGGTTFDLIYALDCDPNNGRWSVVGLDGSLYVGLGSGQITKLTALSGGGLKVTNVGPPGDGLVTARQGHVNYMLAIPDRWLIVAYGGHAASKNAGVWAIEYQVQTDPETGLEYQAWHHLYQESDANIDITTLGFSTEDDATPRLHFALEGTSTSEMYHLEEPLVSGAGTGTTQKKQLTGIMRFPVDDFGDPNTSGAVFQGIVDADDLTSGSASTDEFIKHEDGLDGDADTTNDRGDYVSGDKDLAFGSGAGVSMKKAGTRLTLDRGTGDATRTPKLLDFELQARKKTASLKGFRVPIDLAATAQMEGLENAEVTMNRIIAIWDSAVTVPLKLGETDAQATQTYYVEAVPPSEGSLHGEMPQSAGIGATLEQNVRTGVVELVLEEVL